MTYGVLQLVAASLVVCGASMLKGAIGFGFPLIAVPLLSTIFGPRVAVPVVALPTLLSNLIVMRRGGTGKAAGSLLLVLAGIVAGTVAGALLIKTLDPRLLSALVGSVAILYVLATAFRLTLRIPSGAGERAAPVIGLLAGLMGGATGISSPLLASYLHLLQVTKRQFVFAISVMFLVGNGVQVASYFRLGLYAGPVLPLALLACLPMAVGTWAGVVFLQDRLHTGTFDRFVLTIVFLASLNLLLRSLL
jgi:uncharacterized membrane protein YfcA